MLEVGCQGRWWEKPTGHLRWCALDGFEADLAFLFRTGSADPDHAAADGVQFVVAGDDLDDLPAFQPEAAAEAETVGRTIHDEAGDALRLGAEVDDDTGAFFRDDALGAAAFVAVEGGHGFVLDARSSQVNLY